ncbi:hypothetical protein [Mycolicibacterium fallax]|uniref:Uncharacterized protein n=1 Tax=Mycolicibacterium fallax TaxID=1793 RepID=A0A1X1RNA5_MYCFA|nr:hypothetical protein [Mycolicibacterium fallax]ORV10042.1 hypothetical protein AWC04_01040 [Mycolicibacterium fallax]BBY98350.1 hypothetical protein MFAL_18170 [Mycolicibacterium fallax]
MKPLEILDRDNNVIAEWDVATWTGACADYAQELGKNYSPIRVAALLVETGGDTDIDPHPAAVGYVETILAAAQELDSITVGTTLRRAT